MRYFLIVLLVALTGSFVEAKTVATYTYVKAKKPVKKSIQLQDLKRAYDIVRKSTFNPPTPETFFRDYLRFKMGVELALNDKKLVKSPNIDNMIADPLLKQAFHQSLYTALAELKLKAQTEKLDKNASNLPDRVMRKLYSEEPEFNIFFISVNHPLNPRPKHIQEAEQRAKKIHAQVMRSKKPFLELVALYSDDKSNGVLGINRSKASIFPEVYAKLKTMKNNSISAPIRTATGYMIVRLNRRVPFTEANKTAIKANYFNENRTKLFNTYFDNLKKDFKVNVLNKNLLKSL